MPAFGTVVSNILTYSGQESGGNLETLIKFMVNRVYRHVLDRGLVPHGHREFTLATVASTAQYGMPLYVREILNIEDPTNNLFVYDSNYRIVDRSFPGSTTTGTPLRAFSLGVRGVEKFPASDGVVSIVSSSTADQGSSYKVRVTGFNTSGVLVTELITANGTTAVNSSNSYDSTLGVERVVKEPASGLSFAGNITVKDDDSNTIAVVPVWWDSPEYKWIEFNPIPDAVITYNVRAEMRKPPLVNNGDWPEFDEGFHDLLLFGVTKDLLPTLGKASVADRHRDSFNKLMLQFVGATRQSEAVHVFGDVQSEIGARQRPYRPLIAGVDFGLASSQ